MSDGRVKFSDMKKMMGVDDVYALPEESLSAAFEEMRDKFETLLDQLEVDNATFDYLSNLLLNAADDENALENFIDHTAAWALTLNVQVNVLPMAYARNDYIKAMKQLDSMEAIRIERSRLRRMNQPRSGKRELNV